MHEGPSSSHKTTFETSSEASSIKENVLKDKDVAKFVSLSHFVNSPQELVEQSVSSLSSDLVKSMMPPFLMGKTIEEVKQVLIDEVEGMSRKRLQCIIDGTEPSSSSSSESESESENCRIHQAVGDDNDQTSIVATSSIKHEEALTTLFNAENSRSRTAEDEEEETDSKSDISKKTFYSESLSDVELE